MTTYRSAVLHRWRPPTGVNDDGRRSLRRARNSRKDLHPCRNELPPTARPRAEIDELSSSDRELASVLQDVARLSVRLMVQTAIEATESAA